MDGSVAAGDRVVVLPGTYNLLAPIFPAVPITIEGASGQPVPRLIASGNSAMQVPPGGIARRLYIESSNAGSSRVLDLLNGSLGEQLEVVGTGTSPNVALVSGATLRDSSAWNRDAVGGSAVVTGGTGADLRNVTAIAPLSGGVGVLSDAAFGDTQSVSLRNVIARGPADGQGIQAADDPGIGDSVTVTVSSSNYSSLDDDEPEADIVESGPANQTASPAFANAATGNFHQLSNSLTIDAGSVDPLLGELDIDGEARSQGDGPDIGADELTVTPDQTGATDNFPPETGIRKGPKKKTFKRNAKIEFGGSEPGVTFECQLDDNGFEPCTSPDRLRGLTRGKHVFAVRAVDAAGNRDPTPADRRWKITKKKRKQR